MLKAIYLAAAVGLAALPAHAATMKAVITGKVGSGSDGAGIHGDAGTVLEGLDFVATFGYDTARNISFGTGDLSINGNVERRYGAIEALELSDDQMLFKARNFFWGWGLMWESTLQFQFSRPAGTSTPINLVTPFTLKLTEEDNISSFVKFVYWTPPWDVTLLNLTPHEITVTVDGAPPPAPVPLPAALPLLMAALGGLALLRRRVG